MQGYRKRTDYDTVNRHILARNLQPTTRRSTEIDTTSCGFQERVFLVELYKLEGRTSAVALLSAGVEIRE